MKKEYFEHIDFFKSLVTEARLDKIDQVLEERTRHVTVVLEDTFKVHNISAVMRNLECFGVQDVHLIEDSNSSIPLSHYIAKSSDKWLSLYKYKKTAINSPQKDCIDYLKSQNFQLIALSPHAEEDSFKKIDFSKKTALLLGKENNGLSPEMIEASDHFVRIPMYGFTESFNLSVASALCLQEIIPLIKKPPINWQLRPEEKTQLKKEWILKSVHKIQRYEKALGII